MGDPAVTCRNCGAPAGPQFCGSCGQAIADRRSPLLTLLREVVEEVLSVDGRTLRTLRMLVHPGRLAELYLGGKRAPYLAPMRLYLLASVVLFSSAFALEPLDANEVDLYIGGDLVTEAEPVAGRPDLTLFNQNSGFERWMRARYADNFTRLKAMPPQDAINVVFRGLRSAMPIAMIAFVPVFALFLKLLYVRRHVLYVDHLIFAAHFQAALFFTFAIVWLVAKAVQLPLVWTMLVQFLAFLLMMTIYLSTALRRLHRQSRWLTGIKTFLLFFGYGYALSSVVGPAMVFVISRV